MLKQLLSWLKKKLPCVSVPSYFKDSGFLHERKVNKQLIRGEKCTILLCISVKHSQYWFVQEVDLENVNEILGFKQKLKDSFTIFPSKTTVRRPNQHRRMFFSL